MKFFIDDVETTLENRYQTKLELGTENENKKSDVFVEKYISQKFRIKINDELKKFNYLGKEYENDVVFFYLEISNIEKITNIEIQNIMLFEDFPEQENYIKTKINDIKKTLVLIKENDKEMLNY